jgi:DNA/RNA-binding domain of Phe-tRNA-synthetase-like protein
MRFQLHADIVAKFPDYVCGVMLAQGMRNGSTPDKLLALYADEQRVVVAKIGTTPLSELPSLAAWRGAFRTFGVDPTHYRSAAESLLRRLTKKGDIPSLNLLVDIGNLISIRYALPVAVMDTARIRGAITVHFADGSEQYTPLGEAVAEHPEPGEVIFSDDDKIVAARRWCWRQGEVVAAREETTDAIIVVEAHHANARPDVEGALADFQRLLTEYAGGTYQTGILGQNQTAIAT